LEIHYFGDDFQESKLRKKPLDLKKIRYCVYFLNFDSFFKNKRAKAVFI